VFASYLRDKINIFWIFRVSAARIKGLKSFVTLILATGHWRARPGTTNQHSAFVTTYGKRYQLVGF
jgi:hypothetical protein